MQIRSKVLLGSLGGAAAIHLALVACGSAMMPADGDVAVVDGGADVARDEMSPLDAMIDAMKDAMGHVVDAEVRDAHAQDAGGMDGGTACACPAPARPEYSFALTFDRGPQTPRREYSRATFTSEPILDAGEPLLRTVATASFYTTDGSSFDLRCEFHLLPDRTVVSRPTPTCVITGRNVDGSTQYSTLGLSPVVGAVVVRLTDTEAEIRIPSHTLMLTQRMGSSSGSGGSMTLTNVVFRASVPDAHFITPSAAYRP